jgi:preprotein translocase subunit SecA
MGTRVSRRRGDRVEGGHPRHPLGPVAGEARNAEIRKNVLKYDDVLNRQREAIYVRPPHILEGDDLHERSQNFLENVIDEVLDRAHRRRQARRVGLRRALDRAEDALPDRHHDRRGRRGGGREGPDQPRLHPPRDPLDAKLAYQRREQQLGSPAMRELERRVVLSVIDRRWRDTSTRWTT